ncbi:STAS domain-containing protein [Solwaraspora sp. WMMD792]|uniref:STAS domain-containing protein n=1 Tax=Solwaraspora sp. WMMD792 TaxID=3016099 RepID=UPI002417D3F5|nr:STAS domain-containing protein [Solwaraspora sp. WMMD792]MDG4769832.1 STAS domain-containing protein [Solwaraspora sp. WMMD792]
MDQQGPEQLFSATSDLDGDHLTVTVNGEVDMATAEHMYQAAIHEDAGKVTLDLRTVSFFDSAAIHALLQLTDRYPQALTVLPSRQVRRVLDISGLGGQPWLAAEAIRAGSPARMVRPDPVGEPVDGAT